MPWDNMKGNNKGPWGRVPPPQRDPKDIKDIEDMLRRGQQRFDDFFSGGSNSRGMVVAVLIVLLMWLSSGVYEVDADEQGVVLRFGKFHRVEDPGLNFRFPSPIESVIKVPVTKVHRTEVGVRSGVGNRSGNVAEKKVLEESLMLTGDENIVDIDFEVQWRISNASEFLFNIENQEGSVKAVAESAMREVIGRSDITKVFTEGRLKVEQDAEAIIQSVLDQYKAGIIVERVQIGEAQPPEAVIDAFRDVQTARADRERARNEAEAYRNDIIPRARGEAEKILQEAEAYKQQVVARSKGEADRFKSVYTKYKDAKEVTRERMYLETMESILRGTDKVLLDTKGTVPYLPLPGFRERPAASAEPSSSTAAR